jgi:hypothetical protein
VRPSAHLRTCFTQRLDGHGKPRLGHHVGKFDMYVEDDYAAFVPYCLEDPLDAEIFRARFEPKIERLKLAG